MAEHALRLPLSRESALLLRAGDQVLLSGHLYTGRDAAHKRLAGLLSRGEALPFDPQDQVIYYVGPAPAKPGHAVGPAGPTTSYRMDPYTPALLAAGLRGMVGKGLRSPEVIQAMVRHGCVYFGATGGAAALLSKRILSSQVVAYPDLGTEAIHRLEIQDFPVTVLIDALGNNLYESGPALYRQTLS